MPTSTPEWVAAALVVIFGMGRLSRLITYDDFPPAVWARELWAVRITKGNSWSKLSTCPWCLTPWLVLVDLLAAYFSDLHWLWWAFNIWFALSYAASIVVAYDEPE